MEKKKIMIVDDEEEFLNLAKANLERTGKYEVTVFLDAKDIIPNTHRERPDLILLDLIMPNLGGIEACDMLNNDPIARGIPIVVVTGLSKETDKVKAYKSGVVDYLVKPIELEHLIATIEKALKLKEESR